METTKIKGLVKVKCGKCDGKGEISVFKNILGGVCFTCQGNGFKMMKKAPVKKLRFELFFNDECFFTANAKDEKEALKKTIKHMEKHPNAPAFTGVIIDNISVKLQNVR